jgi:hypothetical protein
MSRIVPKVRLRSDQRIHSGFIVLLAPMDLEARESFRRLPLDQPRHHFCCRSGAVEVDASAAIGLIAKGSNRAAQINARRRLVSAPYRTSLRGSSPSAATPGSSRYRSVTAMECFTACADVVGICPPGLAQWAKVAWTILPTIAVVFLASNRRDMPLAWRNTPVLHCQGRHAASMISP